MCPSQIISLVHELAYYSDSDLRYYYTTIQINFPFEMTHVVNSNYLWEGGDPNTIIKCKKKKKKKKKKKNLYYHPSNQNLNHFLKKINK